MGKIENVQLPDNNDETITALNYRNEINSVSKQIFEKEKVYVCDEGKDESDYETAITHTGFGKFNYLLMLSTIPTATCSLIAATSMSYILPSAECDLQLTHFDKGMMNAITYVGMIVSAFFWGFMSDTLGRRKLLLVAHTLEVIIGVAVGLSQNLTTLLVFKLFSGFISSGPYPMLMAYLAEVHSAKYRPRIILWTGIFMAGAMILIPASAWMIIPLRVRFELGPIIIPSWRLYLLGCTVPGLLGLIIVYFYHESPKFLMACGKKEEALKIFQNIYQINTGKPVHTYPVKALKDDKMKVEIAAGDNKNVLIFLKVGWKQIKPLFLKPHVGNALRCFILQCGTLLGLNTIRLWLPQLFSSVINSEVDPTLEAPTSICELLREFGEDTNATSTITDCSMLTVEDGVYTNSIIVGAITGVGYLSSSFLISKVGKKWLMVILYLIGSGLCMSLYWSTSSDLLLTISSIYVALVSICSTALISVVVDLFPTTLRTMSVSLSLMFGRVGAMIGNLTFPLLLDFNCTVPFFAIGVVLICTSILSSTLPKTMNKPLE